MSDTDDAWRAADEAAREAARAWMAAAAARFAPATEAERAAWSAAALRAAAEEVGRDEQ